MSIINMFYHRITGGTIDELGEIVNDINENKEQKDHLRAMQEKIVELQNAIHGGDMERAGKILGELRQLAKKAGLTDEDPLMAMLNSLDPEGLGERNQPFSKDELREWENFFRDFKAAIDIELDARSDIAGSQQRDLNTYASQLRLSEQAISDIDARWNTAVKEVIGNFKA